MEIKYFVSYKTNYGYGRASIVRPKPIESIEDIEAIEKSLMSEEKHMNDKKLLITNWQRFEKD